MKVIFTELAKKELTNFYITTKSNFARLDEAVRKNSPETLQEIPVLLAQALAKK